MLFAANLMMEGKSLARVEGEGGAEQLARRGHVTPCIQLLFLSVTIYTQYLFSGKKTGIFCPVPLRLVENEEWIKHDTQIFFSYRKHPKSGSF